MNYLDIINDSKINELYLKIKENSNYLMDHAIKHRDNVINYCKKLIKVFEIDDNTANNQLIAASLHDIGRAYNDEEHAHSSAEFALKYLEDKLSKDDVNFIYRIINNHSGFKDRDFYEEILYFADKIDISKDRLEENYKEKYNTTSIMESIQNIDFKIEDNTFKVLFKTDKTISFENFKTEKKKYNIGIIYNVSLISNQKNLKYQIYWDEKLVSEGTGKASLL